MGDTTGLGWPFDDNDAAWKPTQPAPASEVAKADSERIAREIADREARERAELRAYAKGGAQEDAAKAAVRVQRRRDASRVIVGARVVTRNGQDIGVVTELAKDGRRWVAKVQLDRPHGHQTHANYHRTFLVLA